MNRRSLAMLILLGIAATGWIIWRAAEQKPTRLRLAGGGELEMLSVAVSSNRVFSLEPRWKQLARRVLPDPWEGPLGNFTGFKNQLPHEALLVWLRETDGSGKPVDRSPIRQPLVLFGQGFTGAGVARSGPQGTVQLLFEVYPRDQTNVPVRLTHGQEVLAFGVVNPRPIAGVAWQGVTLPQTNEHALTRVVLEQNGWLQPRAKPNGPPGNLSLGIRVVSLGDDRLGWPRVGYTRFDSLGNRTSAQGASLGRMISVPASSPDFKLELQLEEYLSAGFIPAAPITPVVQLPVKLRARELGVRSAAVVQPGRHRFASDGTANFEKNVPADRALSFASTGATNWVIQLDTDLGGMLVVGDMGFAGIRFEARLRERIGPDDGEIFPHWPLMSATNRVGEGSWVAAFLTHTRPSDAAKSPVNPRRRIVTSETQLEAEMVVHHPKHEFVVNLRGTNRPAPALENQR